ncbi:hypothetical protein [Clavibacter capsici]|uniref:hypothetical protein n=1 Tax=Clavibacter capsici TaxID=1874630 RepID=UPI00287B9470|nr:hypothetical protein [Clavibacter capsici]
MPWTGLQLLYAGMELVGMLMTLYGLIAIFLGTKARYIDARQKLDRALELNREEDAAIALGTEGILTSSPDSRRYTKPTACLGRRASGRHISRGTRRRASCACSGLGPGGTS